MRTRGKPIPDDARAAIIAWTPGSGTLNALCDSLDVNRSSARSLRMRAHRQRPRRCKGLGDGNESRRYERCSVEIIATPDDLYTVGARFTALDLEFMLKLSALPNGLTFQITREDGTRHIHTVSNDELIETTP